MTDSTPPRDPRDSDLGRESTGASEHDPWAVEPASSTGPVDAGWSGGLWPEEPVATHPEHLADAAAVDPVPGDPWSAPEVDEPAQPDELAEPIRERPGFERFADRSIGGFAQGAVGEIRSPRRDAEARDSEPRDAEARDEGPLPGAWRASRAEPEVHPEPVDEPAAFAPSMPFAEAPGPYDRPEQHEIQHEDEWAVADDPICPFLATPAGWRYAAPDREHRCTASRPFAEVSADKQDRLCLTDAHVGCPVYAAATGSRRATAIPAVQGRRQYSRTLSTIVEAARPSFADRLWVRLRRVGQPLVIALFVVAIGAVVVKSGIIGGSGSSSDGTASMSPSAAIESPGASGAGPSLSPSDSPSEAPTPEPTVAPTPAPTAAPAGTFAKYTVKKGDTLYGIALAHNTTVANLKKINNLTTNTIRAGQVLNVPK